MWDIDVRRHLTTVPIVAAAAFAMAVLGEARPTAAQTIPEGQSCGGLVCDLGLFGHNTAPSAPAQTAAAPPVANEPKTPKVRKPKRIARAVAPSPATIATPASPAPAAVPPAQASAVSTLSVPAVPAAAKPAVAATSAGPARDEVYIRPNPYTSGLPAPTLILPIGPSPPQP